MRLSAATLLDDSARSTAELRAAGVRPGEVVALQGAQTRAYVAALVALWRLGAVAVPLAPRLPDADGLAARLARVGARWLVTDDAVDVPPGVGVVPVPPLDALPLALPPWAEVDVAAPALVVFTSGSTGTAKAAQLSHGALRASAAGVNVAMEVGAGSAWLLALPLFHVGGVGVLVRMLEAGGSVVLPPPGTPLDVALGGRADARPTHASLVATQLHRLLHGGHAVRLDGVTVLLGGSAIPPKLLDAARAAGVRVAPSYGLTEMASTVTATAPGAPPDDLATSGRLLPGRTLDIVPVRDDSATDDPTTDDPTTDRPSAATPTGEIVVGGATRFDGYLTPGGLVRPFDAAGRFATGDLGHLDAAGRLVVAGRRDRMFVSGGENVHPEAVERAIVALGGIADAVVVAVPDAEYGARAFAFVAPDDAGAPLDAPRLLARLAERLPGPMRPAGVAVLPESPGLKPSRSVLGVLAAQIVASERVAGR